MGWSFRYLPGWGNLLHCFVALYVGEGLERGQCHCLAADGLLSTCPVSSHFTHFPHVTDTLLAVALVEVPRVGRFAFILGPWGPFKQTLLRDWQFLPPPQPPLVFIARSYEALFPSAGTLGCVVWPEARIARSPGIPPDFYPPHINVGPPIPQLPPLPHCLHLATTTPHPLRPGSLSSSLLPVWMNMASLNPSLSAFHTVWFSGSSGWFLFWGKLWSFSWLCKEVKHVYLCLHLDRKSNLIIYILSSSWLFSHLLQVQLGAHGIKT